MSTTGPSQPATTVAGLDGDLSEFARALDVQGAQFAWLLGAGTSAMSDIPTATALILRFKHELYCAANNLDVQEVDPADYRVRARIEDYFDGKNGLPRKGDPEEYAVAFEKVYPSADVRADFITELCKGRTPNFGHYILAALMAVDRLRVVFTTNFDDLVEAGAHSLFERATLSPRPSLVEAALGDPDRAARALQKGTWPVVAKLHGDFRDVRLKNTVGELAVQDERMRQVFWTACTRFGLVVAGYSGRDRSVMQVLADALQEDRSFPAGIYWCYRPADPPDQAVVEFLLSARAAGRSVTAIAVDNFVELAGAVERAVRFPQEIRACLAQCRPAPIVVPTPLPGGPTRPYPILRLNALPLSRLPSHVRRLQETSPREIPEIRQALRTARARGLVARRSGGALVAVGREAELAAALAPLGITVTTDTEELDWVQTTVDPADLGLALDALTLGLGRTEGLRHVLSRRAHQVRVGDPTVPALQRLRSACRSLGGTVPGTAVSWAEAASLTIERRDDAWWLLVVPEIWVAPRPRNTPDAQSSEDQSEQLAIAEFIRERRATRYNRDSNAILDAWVRLLCGGRGPREVRTWNLVEGEGVDPVFEIVGRTAYSRPLSVAFTAAEST